MGQYFPGQSFIHQSHPAFKILIILVYCIFLFQLEFFEHFAFVAISLIALFQFARVPLLLIFQGLKPIIALLLLTLVIHALTTPGEELFRIFVFAPSKEGLLAGAFYAARLLLVVLGSSLLTITTSSVEITYALDRLLKPLSKIGFPVQEFSLMLSISLRFLPVLIEELEKLVLAQTARGANFKKGPWVQRLIAYQSLLIPLFQGALERADQLAIAMEVRGFNPEVERTSFREYSVGKADFLLTAHMGVTLACILASKQFLH